MRSLPAVEASIQLLKCLMPYALCLMPTRLRGLPAVEAVGVVGHQERKLRVVAVHLQLHLGIRHKA